jgi:exopolysaccharide biosynthesis polyprenyl glycosylphosphotransferase
MPGVTLASDAGVEQSRARSAAAPRRVATGPLRSREALVRAALLSADTFGLVLAFAATQGLLLAGGVAPGGNREVLSRFVAFLPTLPLWLIGAALYGLYRRDRERTDHSTADDLGSLFHLLLAGTCARVLLDALGSTGQIKTGELVVFPALALVTVCLCRLSARAFCRRRLAYVQNTLVVGSGRVGQRVARRLGEQPEYGIRVLGFVDDGVCPRADADAGDHASVLGSVDELPELIRELNVERVVFAYSHLTDERSLRTLRRLAELEVLIDIVPRFFEVIGPRARINTPAGMPLIGLGTVRQTRLGSVTKRAVDLIGSALALLVLAPVFVLVATAIKLDSPGRVFFSQTRVGAGGKPFQIFKFRTMVADADAQKVELGALSRHAWPGGDARMFKIADDPRVTGFGRLLRRYSLDELPQLVNVLLGQMSLVGPRPLIRAEDQHVRGWARRRLDVKPGITGLWQVYGASAIPFGEMVQLDCLYVRTRSVGGDVRILLRTLPVVARGAGC